MKTKMKVTECIWHAKPSIFTLWYFVEKCFTIGIILYIGFSQMPFIRFRKFPSVSSLLRAFIRNECLAFSQSVEMIMWSLFLGWFLWWITVMDVFRMLHHPYIPGINSIWTRCIMLLLYCWIQMLNFVYNFVPMFIRVTALWFFLISFILCSLCSWRNFSISFRLLLD